MALIKDSRMRRRVSDFTFTLRNITHCALHPIEFVRGQIALATLKRKLSSIAEANPQNSETVPNIFHFVWGLSGVDELFPYYAYLAVASALFYNPGSKAIFHVVREPSGPFWDRIKSKVALNKIDDFRYFGIARINHYAHKADVVRLLALQIIGGTYLDCDTLTAKSFQPLRRDKFVMGVQASHYDACPGLCNATMMSPRNHSFARRWLRKYRSFHSQGHDNRWDYHSVKIPALLSAYHPEEINVLPFDRFFYPLWTDLPRVLLWDDARKWLPHLAKCFSFHLWNTVTKSDLDEIDDQFLSTSKSVYAHFAAPVIEGDAC